MSEILHLSKTTYGDNIDWKEGIEVFVLDMGTKCFVRVEIELASDHPVRNMIETTI